MRVPYLVPWKGRIPAGKTYDRPVISLDVIPTPLEATGVMPLADYKLDGVKFMPFLSDREINWFQ
jgi:arylsulfatase A-like enzyme